jgi:hypothetical protein
LVVLASSPSLCLIFCFGQNFGRLLEMLAFADSIRCIDDDLRGMFARALDRITAAIPPLVETTGTGSFFQSVEIWF